MNAGAPPLFPEPPPLPVGPPPLPSSARKSRRGWFVGLIVMLLLPVLLWYGPLGIDIHFTDDAGRIPGPFEAALRGRGVEKKIVVQDGHLRVLRGLWDEVEVTDLLYLRARHPIGGAGLEVAIERNTLLKLRQASTGQASIPQRGDPDPRDDRSTP